MARDRDRASIRAVRDGSGADLRCRHDRIRSTGVHGGLALADDVRELLATAAKKKKPKKRKKSAAASVKQHEGRQRQAQGRQGPQVQAAQAGQAARRRYARAARGRRAARPGAAGAAAAARSSSRRSPSTRARSARARPSASRGAPASARAPARSPQLAAMDLEAAVMSFTRPTGQAPLDGPEPMNGSVAINVADRRGRVRLLARPHGPLAPPARRAARARLPRLVGHAPRRREHERGDAQPDEHLPRPRPRQLPRHDPRGDDRPGDAAVPQRLPEPPRRGQRELRPRADGAVHARRGPRRVHGGRRPRARQGADGLARRLQQRLDELALGRPGPLGHVKSRPSSASPGASRGRTPASWS